MVDEMEPISEEDSPPHSAKEVLSRQASATGAAQTPVAAAAEATAAHQSAITTSNPADNLHTATSSNSNVTQRSVNQTAKAPTQALPKSQKPTTSNAHSNNKFAPINNVTRHSAESLPTSNRNQESKTGPGTHRKYSHDSVVTVKRSSLHDLPETHLVATSQPILKSASLQACPPVSSRAQQLATSLQPNSVTLPQRRKSDTSART